MTATDISPLPYSPLTGRELIQRREDAALRAASLLAAADQPGAVVTEEGWIQSAREAAREWQALLDAALGRGASR